MATIKSYTDIEQSRKLAEILSLESADMVYTLTNGYHTPFIRIETIEEMAEDDVLCWSLAALLGLLPKRIEIADNVYELSVYLYGLYYWNVNNWNFFFESKDKDNLVDACVAMIEKLDELNLL